MDHGKNITDSDKLKKALLNRLYLVWLEMPNLRLGQLITLLYTDVSSIYREEDFILVENLETFVRERKLKAILK